MIHAHPDSDARYEVLGDRLARLRQARGLSKTDIAGRLGVTVTSICYWEQGRSRPRLARLQALADLLGTSPTELLSRDSAPGSDHLSDLVTRMRAEIAHAAGTTPSKVRITIEM
ncbi:MULTISPECIES: helix-turn-helix transcriptional regulator [unclassified Sphingopyxis]|uniref:helix-turn-helix domain-containing protein n=1 Tax=Alphaproteobacteria TaxID=28211 RepID=UPI00285B1ABB|nr:MULTISPECIES: helix-turn-helix transcriptional regulator [unclassified Sphingopyxis]MDR7060839.1 transcriptional regulator with XRE-family HTH domain [Sphingopyxis sp. BE235]MDR7181296.1 transcriptional regulator with XRE-family HTH domain [Sphingopyxis sp. BE249]